MYHDYMSFVINKLIESELVSSEMFIPINEAVETLDEVKIRLAITEGNNRDYTNITREEDWILTLQIFAPHGQFTDIRSLAEDLRKVIIKKCCYIKINGVISTANEISLNTNFDSDFSSISILIYVNSKEVI